MTQPNFAWISRGRLYVQMRDGGIREIESQFAQDSLAREMKHNALNEWKGRSGIWGSMGMEPPGAAPWENADPRRNIRFSAVCAGDEPGEIYYVLDMGAVGGLFRYHLERDEESRLMHSQAFRADSLSRRPESGELVISMSGQGGASGLKVTRADGLYGKQLTLSDSVDGCPSWFPDGSGKILFQSAGIGRDDNGYPVGMSTYRIEVADVDSKEVTTFHEEDSFDLLMPRMTKEGTAYFIRRPYREHHVQPPTFLELARDVVCFPYRVARTGVMFLNVMSQAFAGKPLITAGGTPQQRKENRPWMTLHGQMIDARLALRESGKGSHRPLVPKEWSLQRRDADGRQETVAENVVAYDLMADGSVLWTDGMKIHLLSGDGKPAASIKAELVQCVAALA